MIKNLISVVIPAYNVEKEIGCLLDSIYAQTYQYIEIIVVYNEKSTDKTLEVILERSTRHPTIILKGEDRSLGDARNIGMRYANGEFIIFVDGDDVVHPQYLEELYSIFQKHESLDVVSCNFIPFESETDYHIIQTSMLDTKLTYRIYSNIACLHDFTYKSKICPSYVWLYMVRRDFLEKNGILFCDGRLFEDQIWTAQVLISTSNIGHSLKPLYFYRQREGSIVQGMDTAKYLEWTTNTLKNLLPILESADSNYAIDYKLLKTQVLIYKYAKEMNYRDWILYLRKNGLKHMPLYQGNNVPLIHVAERMLFNSCKWCCYCFIHELYNVNPKSRGEKIVRKMFYPLIRHIRKDIRRNSPLT